MSRSNFKPLAIRPFCNGFHTLGQFVASRQQQPTSFTVQEVLLENGIALLFRLTPAILGVAVTLTNIFS